MSEDVEFRPIVSFPDQSSSFVNGFEAGMVWQRMQAGEEVIDRGTPYHFANCEVFHRMADAAGYDIECSDREDEASEWVEVTFIRRPVVKGHLSLVQSNSKNHETN